jgi:hypothetical protein
MGLFSQLLEMFVTAVKIRLTARRNFGSCEFYFSQLVQLVNFY